MEYLKSKYIKDSFVLSNLENKNFNSSSLLLVGTVEKEEAGSKLARGIMKFNLNKIEATSVKKAVLKLFVKKKQTTADCQFPMIVNVGINTGFVHVGSVCWSDAPEFEVIGESDVINKSDIGKYIEIELTNTFNKWLSKEVENNGITLSLENSSKDTIISFSSTKGSKPPYIEYEI